MNTMKGNDKTSNPSKKRKDIPQTKPRKQLRQTKQDENISNNDHNKSQRKITNLPHWVIAIFTILITGITFFYMMAAREQATQMKEAVNIATDTEIRQLRAYVNIDAATITNIADPLPSDMGKNYIPTGAQITNPTMRPNMVIAIKNSGQTPAYKLESWAIPSIHEYPLKSKSILPTKPATKMQVATIGHDGVHYINNFLPNRLTDSQISGLRDGSMGIYINGEITYTDAFMKVRHTKFIGVHTRPISGPIGISTSLAILEEDAD